jgi:hypothetical protein
MLTLIIPDIHNHIGHIEPHIQKLSTSYNFDRIIFLGDYFDQFHDGPADAERTAQWLKSSLQHSNRIHLIGNHDMPYLVGRSTQQLECPGYSVEKDERINNVLTVTDWQQLRPACINQGWLLSHAGFSSKTFLKPLHDANLPTAEELLETAEREFVRLKSGEFSYFFALGSRMCDTYPGGITWADWRDDFTPIEGINQIVGHTPDYNPRKKKHVRSQNHCIDAAGTIFGLLTDGEFSTIKRKTIK